MLVNLLKTLAIELPVYGIYLRREPATAAVFIILLNAFTLPLAMIAIQYWQLNWYLGEVAVALAEGIILAGFWKKPFVTAFAVALAANAASSYFWWFIL